MSIEEEQIEFEKNNQYHERYRQALSGLVVMIIVCLCLSGILGFMILTTPQSKYYATTTTGRVIPLAPLSKPVVTNKYLLQWAELAVRSCYNLTFNNYKGQLKHASSYFTSSGWTALMNAMKKADVLKSLKNNKLFMSAVVDGHPVILNEEVVNHRHQWTVQLPLLVTYTSANEQRKSRYVVTMNIIRVPVLDAAKGIQINKISVS